LKLESQLQLSPRLMHLVPFLGVVMLLLTFFLLGSSMVLQSGVRVRPPTSASLLEPMPRAQIITLSAGRQPQVFWNDRPVSLIGLKEALAEPPRGGARQVLVRADELAAHGMVVRVCQMALDAGYEVVQATTPPTTTSTGSAP
jgi:biopolymer transport protein ExbD